MEHITISNKLTALGFQVGQGTHDENIHLALDQLARFKEPPATLDELYRTVLSIFPHSQIGEDNDGQVVVYTNMVVVTSKDNPSIPAGEHVVQEMN